jgi:DNA polymerase-4
VVTKIIEAEAPLFEKASIDEHYIDITGMDTFFNSFQFAKNLKDKITNETGLPISFGLSTSKTLAKMATNAGKPNGEFVIEPGKEKEFLAPLTVNKIPGVGKKTYETLVGYGIEKIGTIQQMSCDKMEQMLGETGIYIWKKSNGICNSQVVPTREQKSMSTERTFSENTSDPVFLKAKLMSMVSELCFDLRKDNKLTSCVAIKIRYSNFDTATFQTTIDYTSTDDYILKKVLELFHKNVTPHRALRLIGVKFSNLSDGEYQLNLFEDNSDKQKLYSALDNIRNKFGIKSIARAETLATKKK